MKSLVPSSRHYRALTNWTTLNEFLHRAKLSDCKILWKLEMKGKARAAHLKRIESRKARLEKWGVK